MPVPPWLLFDNPDELRERMTRKFYKLAHKLDKQTPLQDPRVVQKFIDTEHTETVLHPKYQGLYDNRFLDPGDLGELQREGDADRRTIEQLTAAHDALYDAALAERVKVYLKRREEFDLLQRIEYRVIEPRGGEFEFRNRFYGVSDAG
jgi:hypothetical protein